MRDTRSVVGLQILQAGSPAEEIAITLPDEALAEEAASALDFLENAELTEERVLFSGPAPKGASWAVGRGYEPDHRKAHLPLRWQDLEGQREIPLEPGYAWVILQAPAGNGFVRRMLERTEQIRPKYDPPEVRAGGETEEAHLRRILERIAEIENFDRGEEFGFPICNLLARQYLGRPAEQDGQLFDSMLDLIERRVDCADFLVCGLIRYIRNYPVSPEREARIRELHTISGAEDLSRGSSTETYADIALGHHRYYNGNDGYPASYVRNRSPYRQMTDVVAVVACLIANCRGDAEAAIQTDRLARIGGFVGGGAAAASDAARETLETAREQKRLLEKIARNTENNSRPGGDGAAGLA